MAIKSGERISILLTSYNQKEYLPEAIDSALGQTYPPYEIIICDDCSTDGSPELIAAYQQKHPDVIKPIYQEVNVGIARNRNTGLQQVQGDYISFLSGDDYFYPRKLECELVALKAQAEAKWAYSGVDLVNALGERIKFFLNPEDGLEGDIFKAIISRKISPRYMLICAEALPEIGSFDEDLKLFEDWHFKMRLAKAFKVVFVPEVLAVYRTHKEGIHVTESGIALENFLQAYDKAKTMLCNIPETERQDILDQLDDVVLEKRVSRLQSLPQKHQTWQTIYQKLKKYPTKPVYYKLAFRLALPNRMCKMWQTTKQKLR